MSRAVFAAHHRKELASLALGLLLFGVLLVPLVHAVHVHGVRGSGHSHAHPHPHPHPDPHSHAAKQEHSHAPDEDTRSEAPDTHEHGAGSLEHPDLLTAELVPLAGELEAATRFAEGVRPPVVLPALAWRFSPAMPQGP